jgi:DNA mismatch endonuclease, patch repair protein
VPDNLTPEQRRRSMAANRGRDTKPEILLRSRLHRSGLRFRKNVTSLPGKPDIVFPSARVAVFVDGRFWHGHNFDQWASELSPQWRAKISATLVRDIAADAELRRLGYSVMHVWDFEVIRSPDDAAQRVVALVRRPMVRS